MGMVEDFFAKTGADGPTAGAAPPSFTTAFIAAFLAFASAFFAAFLDALAVLGG